jgi:dTMP kinase
MFITFEGTEGTGKSTQMAVLAESLLQAGYQLFVTREPGGTAIGDQVRTILSDMQNTSMLPRTEFLLFQSSRAQLVEQELKPRLARGELVLCDRYADSTVAYQGYGYQQLDLEQVRAIVYFATGGLKPDLTILLDIDVELGLRRKRQGGGEWNRLDDYEVAFYQRVRRAYLEMARLEPERWVIIDAALPFDQVQAEIRKLILPRLARPINSDT